MLWQQRNLKRFGWRNLSLRVPISSFYCTISVEVYNLKVYMQERNMFKSCWIHGCPLTPDLPTAHLFQCSEPKAGLVPVYLVHRYRRTGIYRDARRRKLGKVCQNQWLEPPPWGWGVAKDDSHHPQLRLLWLAREGLGVVMSSGRVCRPLQKICFRMMPLLPGGFSFTSSGGRGSKPLELVPPAGLLLVENMASCC